MSDNLKTPHRYMGLGQANRYIPYTHLMDSLPQGINAYVDDFSCLWQTFVLISQAESGVFLSKLQIVYAGCHSIGCRWFQRLPDDFSVWPCPVKQVKKGKVPRQVYFGLWGPTRLGVGCSGGNTGSCLDSPLLLTLDDQYIRRRQPRLSSSRPLWENLPLGRRHCCPAAGSLCMREGTGATTGQCL